MFVESCVCLAGAENDAVAFFLGFDVARLVGGVGDDPLEVGIAGEIFDGRASEGVAEERFGEEEDKSWKG